MTNAEAQFNNSLRPRKPEGSLGRTAQDVHLDSHTNYAAWLSLEGFIKACPVGLTDPTSQADRAGLDKAPKGENVE